MDGEEWVEYDGGAVQEWHRSASRIRVMPHVIVIPARAFHGCNNLIAVDLSNVSDIAASAFYGCSSLKHVLWTTASAVEIGTRAFFSTILEEIDLRNVTKIGRWAFAQCRALKRVTIPSSVVEIEASGRLCKFQNFTLSSSRI